MCRCPILSLSSPSNSYWFLVSFCWLQFPPKSFWPSGQLAVSAAGCRATCHSSWLAHPHAMWPRPCLISWLSATWARSITYCIPRPWRTARYNFFFTIRSIPYNKQVRNAQIDFAVMYCTIHYRQFIGTLKEGHANFLFVLNYYRWKISRAFICKFLSPTSYPPPKKEKCFDTLEHHRADGGSAVNFRI
jgi:hypothetical protein